jgi:hypothetical protein
MHTVESGVNQAVEIISSQQKELQEICEVVCGQNKKLANLVNQVFISTGMLIGAYFLFVFCSRVAVSQK